MTGLINTFTSWVSILGIMESFHSFIFFFLFENIIRAWYLIISSWKIFGQLNLVAQLWLSNTFRWNQVIRMSKFLFFALYQTLINGFFSVKLLLLSLFFYLWSCLPIFWCCVKLHTLFRFKTSTKSRLDFLSPFGSNLTFFSSCWN